MIKTLTQKISNLRFFIYVFVAVAFLFTALVIFWYQSPYSEQFNINYVQSSRTVKALLYVMPQEGSYNIGDEFDIDILINTANSNIVATAAYLSFNKDVMQAMSINTSDSVFGMDIEKEIIDDQGKIKITVGRPTPGVKSNAGKVATVHFKAIEKTAPVLENIYFNFTEGSSLYSTVIIDDKKGTNVLSTTKGAKILIN